MRSREAWRQDFVPREEFRCACGCELRLSRGDLADAIACAAKFAGKPRTWGVTLSSYSSPYGTSREVVVVETRPCPRCDELVSVPDYAASLLDKVGGAWPICEGCRAPVTRSASSEDDWA